MAKLKSQLRFGQWPDSPASARLQAAVASGRVKAKRGS